MNDRELRRYRGLCDLHGQLEGSSFRPESYVQIRTCGTYRCRSQPLAAFLDESRVASHVVGMLLTVAALVIGTRSVHFLLVLIGAAKVIRVLGPPLPTRLLFLLAATVRLTAGFLPLLEPRMRIKPTMTKRTSPPCDHSSPPVNFRRRSKQERARKEKK